MSNRVLARDLVLDVTSVSATQCRVPEGVNLNARGQKVFNRLQTICMRGRDIQSKADGDDDDWFLLESGVRSMSYHRIVSALLVKKSLFSQYDSEDLVVVGAIGKDKVITTPIVMQVGNVVMTRSGSVYRLQEMVSEEELVKRNPHLLYDLMTGTTFGGIVGQDLPKFEPQSE